MKIHGLGTDIVNIQRMSQLIKKNTNFKKRIFSQSEIRQCNANTNKYACYSKRFAAKEAFSKALGTGISNGLNFNEIVIKNDNKGKPNIYLYGKSLKVVKKELKKNLFDIMLTISDDKPFAVATVIITL